MIFTKIKLNYNIKLIDDLINDENYKGVSNLIFDKRENPSLFYDLIKHLHNKFFPKENVLNSFPHKFVWINSYDKEDAKPLNDFLSFYLKNNNNFALGNYSALLSEVMSELKLSNIPKHIDFDYVLLNSDILHSIIMFYKNVDYYLLTSQSAFFEAPNNKFLIYPQTTLAFFSVFKNPLSLYCRYQQNSSNQQDVLNKIINFDLDKEQNLINSNSDYSVVENKQSWGVHAQSWMDDNVKNTYRGKQILYEEMVSAPYDTFLEVLYHLKQCGMNVDIDHNLIKSFIDAYQFIEDPKIHEISKNDKKIISNSIDPYILKELNYNF